MGIGPGFYYGPSPIPRPDLARDCRVLDFALHHHEGLLPVSYVGSTIGNYRIESWLGQGGMGEVYRGYDPRLERRVAVKTIHSKERLSPVHKARFLREARLLGKLGHPAICQVYDLIETPEADFLILQRLDPRRRPTAEEAAAELRALRAKPQRRQAEGLIGFMLNDLRPCLERVNRLDLLDAVGDRALAYFGDLPEGELTRRELLHRAQDGSSARRRSLPDCQEAEFHWPPVARAP